MTLSRQLILLILGLLLSVFIGTFLISVHNARDYLQRQLHSHAEDAATYLGLAISSRQAVDDVAIATSMTDALFDSGFYRVIRIEDQLGKPLVERQLPLALEEIPLWFIELFPLQTPVGESALMRGWVKRGRVTVQSHPGFAYAQLWATFVDSLKWFLLSALAACLVAVVLLRQVLRPLKQIERQADAICRREFPTQKVLPRSRDMRLIVEAMNRMSVRVAQMLSELESLASGLRAQAYQDSVTGLPNRRYFNDLLLDQVSSTEEFSRGALCLIELRAFKEYNEQRGYPAGDELLRAASERLRGAAAQWPMGQVAHLSGADFAILVRECSEEQVKVLAQQLSAMLAELFAADLTDTSDVGHIGVAYYDGRQSASELLALADTALRIAQVKGANAWHLQRSGKAESGEIKGAHEWQEFIGSVLAQGELVLQFQPVVSTTDGQLLHQEVLVRMPRQLASESGDELLEAALFIPQAERLGMITEVDRVVVAELLRYLSELTGQIPLHSVNLSPHSLGSETFVDWLEEVLRANQSLAPRLIFEFPEYGVLERLESLKEIAKRLSVYGSRISLDHFGRSFGSLASLRSMPIHCLKIDGSFIRSIDESQDNRFFVQALAEIAHGLEIEVIAEAVETEAVWNVLRELHVDGAQGYYIGRPE